VQLRSTVEAVNDVGCLDVAAGVRADELPGVIIDQVEDLRVLTAGDRDDPCTRGRQGARPHVGASNPEIHALVRPVATSTVNNTSSLMTLGGRRAKATCSLQGDPDEQRPQDLQLDDQNFDQFAPRRRFLPQIERDRDRGRLRAAGLILRAIEFHLVALVESELRRRSGDPEP
jgi:hypothetical protein